MPVVMLPPPDGGMIGIVGVDGNGSVDAGVVVVANALPFWPFATAGADRGGVGDRDVVATAFGVVDGAGC